MANESHKPAAWLSTLHPLHTQSDIKILRFNNQGEYITFLCLNRKYFLKYFKIQGAPMEFSASWNYEFRKNE